MKSARELFEELGYTKLEQHDDISNYIKYISNDEDFDFITFYCDDKTFCIGEYVLCNFKLLQAINKQIEELGWNKC